MINFFSCYSGIMRNTLDLLCLITFLYNIQNFLFFIVYWLSLYILFNFLICHRLNINFLISFCFIYLCLLFFNIFLFTRIFFNTFINYFLISILFS